MISRKVTPSGRNRSVHTSAAFEPSRKEKPDGGQDSASGALRPGDSARFRAEWLARSGQPQYRDSRTSAPVALRANWFQISTNRFIGQPAARFRNSGSLGEDHRIRVGHTQLVMGPYDVSIWGTDESASAIDPPPVLARDIGCTITSIALFGSKCERKPHLERFVWVARRRR
jgi:hypothetical protein